MTDPETDGPDPSNHDTAKPGERTFVVVPDLRMHRVAAQAGTARALTARLEEAVGLAAAIELPIVDAFSVPLAAYRPATLLGSGKVIEIGKRIAEEKIGLVVIDHPLTPVQQRNLEREWKTKVIDRTGLILEIFGERADTREGRLQVELAHLNYQKGRLVRSWTHLERQRGGFGFLGGPGETQIEADRRVIENRIARIERDLEKIVEMRRLQRRSRRRSRQPIVALVGYTNAGKSTLFNRLTGADRLAVDKLFATLDPTLRQIELPGGGAAILSDTVGFVSDLPTDLVAAFRATLEEVVEADLILHVRDIAHGDSEAQASDVRDVLEQLGVDLSDPERMIEVWNKIDLLPAGHRPAPPPAQTASGAGGTETVAVSAITGEGVEQLLALIEARLTKTSGIFRITLPVERLGRLHEIYAAGEVLARQDREDGSIGFVVRVPEEHRAAFMRLDPSARPDLPAKDED